MAGEGCWFRVLCSTGFGPRRQWRSSDAGAHFRLKLRRGSQGFPSFEFFHGSLPVRTVSLIVALLMVIEQESAVAGLVIGLRKTALQQQARLRQSQCRRFFLNLGYAVDSYGFSALLGA